LIHQAPIQVDLNLTTQMAQTTNVKIDSKQKLPRI